MLMFGGEQLSDAKLLCAVIDVFVFVLAWVFCPVRSVQLAWQVAVASLGDSEAGLVAESRRCRFLSSQSPRPTNTRVFVSNLPGIARFC